MEYTHRNRLSSSQDGIKVLQRRKRGWLWNQFFLLEEYTGSDTQYVGKLYTDHDNGEGNLKYILSGDGAGSVFIIDENTGDIQAAKRLDREEKSTYVLRAKAIDKRTGRQVEPESEFIIKIHDINDNEPKFNQDVYIATVPEMSEVGTSVLQVTASDADDPSYGNSARIVYSILQGQPYFSIDPDTGIIKTALPDMSRENREHYQVVIQAKDMGGQMGGLSGTTTVNITLTDVNDNPPRFPQTANGIAGFEFERKPTVSGPQTVTERREVKMDADRAMISSILDEYRIGAGHTSLEDIYCLQHCIYGLTPFLSEYFCLSPHRGGERPTTSHLLHEIPPISNLQDGAPHANKPRSSKEIPAFSTGGRRSRAGIDDGKPPV
ncbi:cadherin-9-like [Bufo gargarizans]|uniref:cadherin-9-like n=1 Tax=Bufo gargarizans TaxID=30331 RepID=UPI001CF3222D|nr:cadherin-9-like [Bufo gargarizans]